MAPRDSDEFKRDDTLRSPFRASSAIPAFPHVLISASLETRKRQIVASVSVRFPGRRSPNPRRGRRSDMTAPGPFCAPIDRLKGG